MLKLFNWGGKKIYKKLFEIIEEHDSSRIFSLLRDYWLLFEHEYYITPVAGSEEEKLIDLLLQTIRKLKMYHKFVSELTFGFFMDLDDDDD